MNRILGLDVSTKTIGIALFEKSGKLLELTHVTPMIKPLPESKVEVLFKKADTLSEFITKYIGFGIDTVVIEEPLLRSNNVNTVGTLLRFNGMISKIVYDTLNVTPEFISSYDSRKYAFPSLMGYRVDPKGKPSKNATLFGGHPKTVDKKMVIWEKVAELEPQINWSYTKKNTLKTENFDMSDSYCAVLGYMKKNRIW